MDNSLSVADTSPPKTPTPLVQSRQSGDAEQVALELAGEVFGVIPTIADSVNPEFPDDVLRVVTVQAPGNIDELVQRTSTWHQRMIAALGERGTHITICVLPVVP